MPSRIEDYALIGDCHTAALVARDGSIDWLCFPRFDSKACFAALLGTPENGRWKIAPDAEVTAINRRYREGTLILETEYRCEQGTVALIDFMPPRSAAPDVVRIVECRSGEVPMKSDLTIRYDYGSIVPWVRHIDRGIRATAGPDTIYCRGDVEMHGEDMHTCATFKMRAGMKAAFHLVWSETHTDAPQEHDPHDSLTETEEWWRDWSGRCRYDGRWRDAVVGSLITLKALTYAPTGGVVAAATTSLPEKMGGVRNWDYRYCWVRDATFTLYCLLVGGYTEEACAWREWLINAVAGTPADLQIMYGVAGERRLTEFELDWLPGYERSLPVRIGNGAHTQFQLDVYGEVMDALQVARRHGIPPNENAWRVQRALMGFLESAWREPDEGIWEMRGPRRHFTHSKVMAWVAMDRAVQAVEEFGLPGDARKWSRVREEIRQDVFARGFNPDVNAFVQYYGSEDPDASLLMLPLVGFVEPDDAKMRGTVQLIERALLHDGFVHRYPNRPHVDGLPPGEGVFLLCTFWYADNLALQGRMREAEEVLQRLLELRNDVGLLAEEYDLDARRFAGNFPQAFSHIGLINTARNLDRHGGPAEERQHQKGEQE